MRNYSEKCSLSINSLHIMPFTNNRLNPSDGILTSKAILWISFRSLEYKSFTITLWPFPSIKAIKACGSFILPKWGCKPKPYKFPPLISTHHCIHPNRDHWFHFECSCLRLRVTQISHMPNFF